MDPHLKLYIINALVIGEDGRDAGDENGIDFGEPPYEAFYQKAIGREVDIEEEGYEEIEGVKEYLLAYPLTTAQLESITYLGLETNNSAYETFICPYWDFEDGVTTVDSLEGIEALPNLEAMNLDLLAPACSLQPLSRLTKLAEITGLPSRLKDYSPLLEISSLKKIRAFGYMEQSLHTGYMAVMNQLAERGVLVENKVTVAASAPRFGGL